LSGRRGIRQNLKIRRKAVKLRLEGATKGALKGISEDPRFLDLVETWGRKEMAKVWKAGTGVKEFARRAPVGPTTTYIAQKGRDGGRVREMQKGGNPPEKRDADPTRWEGESCTSDMQRYNNAERWREKKGNQQIIPNGERRRKRD